MAERTGSPDTGASTLPSAEEAIRWVGMRVDGLENRSLGRAAGVYADSADGTPRWVAIRRGPFSGCTAIPVEHVAEGFHRLWAAYERGWVHEGPRVRPDAPLTAELERELCLHCGYREGTGRLAELEGRSLGETTSVPLD